MLASEDSFNSGQLRSAKGCLEQGAYGERWLPHLFEHLFMCTYVHIDMEICAAVQYVEARG